MTGRDIIQALHAGRRVYSSAMVAPSPLWPNLVKQAGIDFVFLDTEHTQRCTPAPRSPGQLAVTRECTQPMG